MRKLFLILAWLGASIMPGYCRAETVTVYTSANFAPLVVGEDSGVYHDMVDYLNRQKLPGLDFKLSYLPRKRLQMMVEENRLDGIVIGMMPHWFDDTAQQKYLWTTPFALDRFVVVTRADSGLKPLVSGAMTGRSVGLVLGYVYPDLDDWIQRAGLVRSDGIGEEANLEKLRMGRVDCVAAAESVVRYYMRTHAAQAAFLLTELPARQTERRFLVPHAKAAVHRQLAPVIRKLKDDPAWQRIMAKYN